MYANLQNPEDMSLSQVLVREMKRKQLNYSQLSRRAEVAKSTIHNWASGRMVKDLSELRRVASVLEISIYELLFDEPDPYSGNILNRLSEVFSGEVRLIIEKVPTPRNALKKND